ncbi:hypothetical protein BJY52DRAFT_1278563, partial [Lactarius psammicola]
MTNDAEPTEVDHGFVNNVYTAPPKPVLPEPEPSTAPPSYHSESEVEHEPVDKVADRPTTNGTALHVVRDIPTPTADAAPEQQPRAPWLRQAPIEVEKVADEITSEPEAPTPKDAPAPTASEPIQVPVPELAPNVPIGILPNSTLGSPSEDPTPTTAQVDSEHERSTHVPLLFASGTAAPAVVPQVEEAAPAPEPVSQSEETTPAPVKEEEAPEETILSPVEEEGEPEETTPAPVEEPEEVTPALVDEGEKPEVSTPVLVEAEVESPKEAALAPAEVEGTEASAVHEPTPAPPTEPEPVPVPAVVEEPEPAPPQEPEEVAAPASQEAAVMPEPSPEPAPEPVPVPEAKAEVAVVQVPVAEPTPEVVAVSRAPVADPTPVVEAVTKAPAAEPTPVGAEAVVSSTPAAEPAPVVEAVATKAAPEPTPQVALPRAGPARPQLHLHYLQHRRARHHASSRSLATERTRVGIARRR